MSESIKNLQATTLRMAGNIAAGLAARPEFSGHGTDAEAVIVDTAVRMAQRIVRQLTADLEAPKPNPDPRCPKCGYTMVQGFTEVHVSSTRSLAHPNGEYRCFHCTATAEATK